MSSAPVPAAGVAALAAVQAAAVAALALLAGGCRGESRDPVAAAVAAGVREQLGVAAQRVSCTRDRCEIELAGGLTIAARVTGDREVVWESDEVVRTAPITAYVRAELEALGVDAPVDCGPSLILAATATRITCTIGPTRSIMDRDGASDLGTGRARDRDDAPAPGTAAGSAWVDVLADGGLALELALDEEAVRARTDAVDPLGLDELSRALDTDEAQGGTAAENVTEADDAADAGMADAGTGPDAGISSDAGVAAAVRDAPR